MSEFTPTESAVAYRPFNVDVAGRQILVKPSAPEESIQYGHNGSGNLGPFITGLHSSRLREGGGFISNYQKNLIKEKEYISAIAQRDPETQGKITTRLEFLVGAGQENGTLEWLQDNFSLGADTRQDHVKVYDSRPQVVRVTDEKPEGEVSKHYVLSYSSRDQRAFLQPIEEPTLPAVTS